MSLVHSALLAAQEAAIAANVASAPTPLFSYGFEGSLTNAGSDSHAASWVESGAVGNSKTGVYTASGGGAGGTGQAASFDGSSGMPIVLVSSAGAVLTNISVLTVTFDFYFASFASKRAIWMEGTWGILFDSATDIYFYHLTTGGNWPLFILEITLSTNTWYNIRITYSNAANEIKLYIDGTQRGGTKTANGTFANNGNNSLYIGSDGTNSNNVSGRIDNLKIYDSVVTP